jgi:hypothetical protein
VSKGLYILSTLEHSRLRICLPKMFFAETVISAMETLRFMTQVGLDCPQY